MGISIAILTDMHRDYEGDMDMILMITSKEYFAERIISEACLGLMNSFGDSN